MYSYDIIAMILIGISHVLLYIRLIRYDQLSTKMIVAVSLVFTILLVIVVTATGYPEFNTVLVLLFLVSLGLMKRSLPVMQSLYFALISLVGITFAKMVLMEIGFQLFMLSPLNLYMWTYSIIHLIISIGMIISIILWRNQIQKFAQYMINSRLYYISYLVLFIGLVIEVILTTPSIQFLASLHQQYGEVSYIAALIVFFVLLLVALIGSHLAREKLVEEQQERLHRERLDYVEKLEFTYAELVSFRHDYLNILLALDGAIRTNDIDQIKKVYDEVIAPTSQLINDQELDLVKFSSIKIPEVKSVLSVKVVAARQQKLQVLVDIPEDIEQITMPVVDFIRASSILLDNAIEEALQSKEKALQIAFFEIEGQQFFIVRNSCQQQRIDLQKIYENRYSSKEGDRGYGLFSLKRMIDKTNYATLETSFTAPYFIQTLRLKK